MWTLMLHIAYSVYVENKILIFFFHHHKDVLCK